MQGCRVRGAGVRGVDDVSSAAAASARSTPAPPAPRTAARPPPRLGPSAVSYKRRKALWLSYGTPANGQAPYCDLRPLQGQRRVIKTSHVSNYFLYPSATIFHSNNNDARRCPPGQNVPTRLCGRRAEDVVSNDRTPC